MKTNSIWLKIFNVRSEEVSIVRKLFFLQFFQGAGIAFFMTASLTLLLERFQLDQIPFVFIFSAILLWIFGFVYSKLEHRFPLNKVAFMITIFMIASILFFRFAFIFWESNSFVFVMLPWFYVLYLLNNLEFWGVASLIFDARQSKRLFGVISAGDIPAKFIGYSLAGLAVHYIGTINLLWAALACLLASIPFLINVKEARVLHDHHHNHNHDHKNNNPKNKKPKKLVNQNPQHNIKKIIENYLGNALIMRLALLGILMSVSFLIINFSFWTKVKHAFHDDVQLANFIAFFNAIISLVFLFIKLIFTSRLINKLGIIKSLLITPLVMLLMIGIVIYTEDLGNQVVILYCFGATYSIVDILKTSINNPVFLTIMQPLSNHERLRAHMILKGITDPFAFLFAGLSLLAMIQLQGKVDLANISYEIFFICLLWLVGVYAVNKQYLKTIVKTISSKFFNMENLSVKDTDTLEWLKSKLKTGSETEVLNIFAMLSNEKNQLTDELLIILLQNQSEKVRTAVLNLMLETDFPEAAKSLIEILKHDVSPSILAKSIKVICKHNIQPDDLLEFLKSDDPEIRNATLDGLFFYAQGNDKEIAAYMIQQMIFSENDEDRIAVSHILSNHKCCKETEMIITLMNDKNPTVRKFAFIAAGKSINDTLLNELILSANKYEIEMIEPLYLGGTASLPHIYNFISSQKTTKLQREKLILLIGRINDSKSYDILISLIEEMPEEYHNIAKALYRSSFTPKQHEREIFISLVRKMLSRCAGIIYLQNGLINLHPGNNLLFDSLSIELEGLKETILYIFAILYNRSNINKVRKAYATGDKASIINAMELIDITVRKDLAVRFNSIFEPVNVHDRIHDIEQLYEPEIYSSIEEIINSILEENVKYFNDWTIACSLYTAKQIGITFKKEILKNFCSSDNKLLKETALFVTET